MIHVNIQPQDSVRQMSETKARNKEDICRDTPRTDIWPNHTAVVLQVTSLCTIMQWWVGVAHGFPWFLGRLCYSVPKTISASSTHDTISVTDQIPDRVGLLQAVPTGSIYQALFKAHCIHQLV